MAQVAAYSAVADPYHYDDGVLALGESAELSDEQAARGLASGAIVVTPSTPAAPSVPKNEETT